MEYNSVKIKNYLQEVNVMPEENWNEQAKGILKAHLARKNIKYHDLAKNYYIKKRNIIIFAQSAK